jgi:predicted cobalt transporter CbtA
MPSTQPHSLATDTGTRAVMFRRTVLTSCLVGLLTGIVVAGLQPLVTVPIILEAETYEGGGMDAAGNAHTHGS